MQFEEFPHIVTDVTQLKYVAPTARVLESLGVVGESAVIMISKHCQMPLRFRAGKSMINYFV